MKILPVFQERISFSWCHGSTPASSSDSQTCCSLLPSGTEERIRKVTGRKHVGWDKGRLVGEITAHSAKQKMEFIPHFSYPGRCSSYPQESQAPSPLRVAWGDKPSLWKCPLAASVKPLGMGHLRSAGVTCPSCALSQILAAGGDEEQKRPWQCKCCSATTETSLCYQHFPAWIKNTAPR